MNYHKVYTNVVAWLAGLTPTLIVFWKFEREGEREREREREMH